MKKSPLSALSIGWAFVILLMATMSLSAGSVSLGWEPPRTCEDGSPLVDLSGYRLYHGGSSRGYVRYITVSNSNYITYTNLYPGITNFFAITAVNSLGEESDYSEEIALYVPPAVVVSSGALEIAESESSTLQIRLDAAPAGVTTVLVSRVDGGNAFLGAVDGTELVFTPTNWAECQTVKIVALQNSAQGNASAVFRLSGDGVQSASAAVTAVEGAKNGGKDVDAVDADGNSVPDAWEITHFGGLRIHGAAANDDTDHDGVPNTEEYIAGTDPKDHGSRPQVSIVRAGGDKVQVSFRGIAASGLGYAGKTRFYTLERTVDPQNGKWQPVASAKGRPAHDQVFRYVDSVGADRASYYRIKIHLL